MIKGQITLSFVDARTGVKTREPLVFCNQITEYFYYDIPASEGRVKSGSLLANTNTIGVSSHSTPPVAGVYTTIGAIKGSGVTLARNRNYPQTDGGAWTYHPEQDPPYTELFNILPYPGSGLTRTFQTIFLARDNSVDDANPVYAYVVAPAPIVQGGLEYINIFYKIINYASDGVDTLVPSVDRDIVNGIIAYSNSTGQGGNQFTTSEFVSFPVPQQPVQHLRRTGLSLIDAPQAQITAIPSFFSHKISVVIPVVQDTVGGDVVNNNGFVGTIINSVGVGNYDPTGSYYRINAYDLNNGAKYQGYFPHNLNADTPFVDLSSTPKRASGKGLLSFGGAWTGTLPEHYRVVITGTGEVGVATYQLQRKRHTGFLGNTYVSGRLQIPYINHAIATFEGFYGFNNTNFMRVSDDEIASWDADGICVINLRDGHYTVFDANSVGLETSLISQIACDATLTGIHQGTSATKIWVACRVTGLWEIDLSLETCSQLVSDPCYAVDVGYMGKVFAVFDGVSPRLANSDDFLAPLSFSVSSITSAWAQVKFIKCDPNSSIFQCLLNYGSSGATVWWNTSSPSGATGPTLAIANQNSFDVSDVDSTWFGVILGGFYSSDAHYVAKLTVGSNSAISLSTAQGTACAPNPCIIGNKLLVQFGTNQDSSLGQAYSLHNTSDGSLIDRFDFIGGNWYNTKLTPANSYLIYLGRNLTFYGSILDNFSSLVSAFNNKSYAFDSYGWNGSSWVRGGTGSRVTHSTSEPLFDGVTFSFADGSTGTSFVATDYYDVFFNDGRLKANTATFPYTNFIWYRAMAIGTILSGQNLRVPLSAPYTVKLPKATGGSSPDPLFLLAYILDPSFFAIKLDGNDALIDVLGNPPDAGEVSVSSNGTLTFNAADAGRLITSTKYSYLKR